MFSKIITLSLNPALDITLWTETLQTGVANVVECEQYDAAGKSMNVTRTLRYYGVDSSALVLAGKHNLYRYEQRLKSEKVNYKLILVDGYIRENLSIIQSDHSVTRLMREGFCVEYEVIEEIKEELANLVTENSLVVISGQLPKGISPNVFKMICKQITDLGGSISLDTSSLSLGDIYDIKPWLMKPNYVEACQLAGKKLESEQDIVEFGKDLNMHGIKHCIVSAGAEGLYHTCADGALHVMVPAVDVCSSVGAGDCCLAGFIRAIQQGGNLEGSLKLAAAFGTAACLTEGTNPPPKLASANILLQVETESLPY